MRTLVDLQDQLEATRQRIIQIQREPKYIVGFLHAGRLFKVNFRKMFHLCNEYFS